MNSTGIFDQGFKQMAPTKNSDGTTLFWTSFFQKNFPLLLLFSPVRPVASGGAGGARAPQFLADQLTLYLNQRPEGVDCAPTLLPAYQALDSFLRH